MLLVMNVAALLLIPICLITILSWKKGPCGIFSFLGRHTDELHATKDSGELCSTFYARERKKNLSGFPFLPCKYYQWRARPTLHLRMRPRREE